jgi:hypothetical protein
MSDTMSPSKSNPWIKTGADSFWKDVAALDHVLQFYENDEVFLETLAGFVGGGINAGDCCIVIATRPHLDSLNLRLREHVVHIDTLIADHRYIQLDAEETLSRFMVNGRPDEGLFNQAMSGVVQTAINDRRNIRAFGEMVSILWRQGLKEATLELERLWTRFCSRYPLSLFCAYSQSDFERDPDGIGHVCHEHGKLLAGSARQLTTIYYRELTQGKSNGKPARDHSLMES